MREVKYFFRVLFFLGCVSVCMALLIAANNMRFLPFANTLADTTTTTTVPSTTTTTVPTTTTTAPTTTTVPSTTTTTAIPTTTTAPTTTTTTVPSTTTTTGIPTTTTTAPSTTTTPTAPSTTTTIPSTTTTTVPPTTPKTTTTVPNTTTTTPPSTTTTTPATTATTTAPDTKNAAPTTYTVSPTAANATSSTPTTADKTTTVTTTPPRTQTATTTTPTTTTSASLLSTVSNTLDKAVTSVKNTVVEKEIVPGTTTATKDTVSATTAPDTARLTVPVVTSYAQRINAALDLVAQKADTYVDTKCASLGINLGECKETLFNQYAKDVVCRDMSDTQCKTTLKKDYSNMIITVQDKFERIKTKAAEIFGDDMTVSDLEKTLSGDGQSDISVPLESKDTKVRILRAVGSVVLDKVEGLIQSAPMAVTIDTDGDGLPDDTEKRIGTDPAVADTDGDGYSDGEEVMNGYNPRGTDMKKTVLSPIERAIMENKILEHPKASGEEKSNFSVDKIENNGNATADGQGYTLSGRADANSIATIYVYSDIPVVTTVTTDDYGNWEYHFDQSLEDGNHEVYVAINDNTGKVVSKSKPLDFLVNEAKAVSPKDLAATQANNTQKVSANMTIYYLFTATALIFFGIIIFLFAVLKQKNKLQQ